MSPPSRSSSTTWLIARRCGSTGCTSKYLAMPGSLGGRAQRSAGSDIWSGAFRSDAEPAAWSFQLCTAAVASVLCLFVTVGVCWMSLRSASTAKPHVTTAYTFPASAPQRQTTIVSNCHVVFGWFQLELSCIVAGEAGADFFHTDSCVLPVSSSFIPYQPCFLPLRRSTLVADGVWRFWFVCSGSVLAPLVVSTRRTVWMNAISSASTTARSGVNTMLIL